MEHTNLEESRYVLSQLSVEDKELSPNVMRLRELIDELSELDKKVYNLVFINDLSYSQAAEMLNIGKSLVEYHCKKIRNYIKENF